MRIGLFTDLAGQRVWHRWLADELAWLGHDLEVYRPSSGVVGVPPGVALARWLDPIWYRLTGEHAFDTLEHDPLVERRVGEVGWAESLDVLIDVAGGSAGRPKAASTVRVTFDGATTELAVIGPVLGTAPIDIALNWVPASRREHASPSVVRRECLTTSLDIVFSGLVELLSDRIHRRTWLQIGNESNETAAETALPARPNAESTRHVWNLVRTKLARYLGARTSAPGRWAIATRSIGTNCLFDGIFSQVPTRARFGLVPDDGQRYYADPFLFSHAGKTHLFCEEYPLSTRRGIISVAEVSPDGSIGAFRSVIERPYHMSYPFVFKHDGQIWMMPETCESGALELYRADRFPDRWVLDRVVIDGIRACDATIVQMDGQYCMILTSTRWNGSTSDKQRVFYGSSPLGPWTEHGAGLLRLDSVCARPGGSAFRLNGRLFRPTQDCSTRYGGALTLLETEDLSAAAYREEPVARVEVKTPEGIVGTHTYSANAWLEAVDVFGAVGGIESAELEVQPLAGSRNHIGNRAHTTGTSVAAS